MALEPFKLLTLEDKEFFQGTLIFSNPILGNYLNIFLALVPEYCCDENGNLLGPTEEWESMLISNSLYLGLGIGAIDVELTKRLLGDLTHGEKQTCRLVLKGINEIKKQQQVKAGDKWNNTVRFINRFLALTTPKSSGQEVKELIIKQRATISGFIPGLCLSIVDRDFALALAEDAIQEQEKCTAGEFFARIFWMKRIADDAMN